ncbi:hypothetical protein ACP70R_017247 [Stipagrostis hirtigluma subsp. patula]
MLVGMDGEMATAAASSECSSGCQSGWTTYLDDHSSRSCGAARFRGKMSCCEYSEPEAEEEDDMSMISDASSGPRQQCSAGNGGEGARAGSERRGRRADAAAARRQSKKATAASLLEDTASSSPAFFSYSKAMNSEELGYGAMDAPMAEAGNAADFSCAFSATTGFTSPLAPLGGYLQMQQQYSAAPAKPMATRQVYRDGGEKKRW